MDRVKISGFSFNFFYPVPLALTLIVLRHLLERLFFEPIGVTLGIKSRVEPKKQRSMLKNSLGISNWIFSAQVYNLSKYLDFSENFYKQKSLKTRKLTKFCKSTWNFSYFTYAFVHGMVILWDKSWFWNINECWTDYPHQKISNEVWLYYNINLAFYWSLLITLLVDVRRKDFQENAVHHSVAILLIYFSLIMNAFKIGTIVLVVLSVSDIFMEGAKMAKYLKYTKTCNASFGLFTIVWIISRLGLYPFWIIRNTLFDVPKTISVSLEWYLINSLLLSLVALNFFWTYMIFKVLWKALTQGEVEDVRSDSESDS